MPGELTPSLPAADPDTDADWCRAVSQEGAPVTVWVPGLGPQLVFARPGRDWICTQDPGHEGSHKACDGHGHVLARWPRRDPEHYWKSGDCLRECRGHGLN